MKKMYNCGAGCERGNSQVVTVNNSTSPSILALSVTGHKLFTRFRLVAFHREPNSKGFFTSAATDAIDNLLKSARCSGKIGTNLSRMMKPSHRSDSECTSSEPPSYHGLANNVTVQRTLVT